MTKNNLKKEKQDPDETKYLDCAPLRARITIASCKKRCKDPVQQRLACGKCKGWKEQHLLTPVENTSYIETVQQELTPPEELAKKEAISQKRKETNGRVYHSTNL